MKRIALFAAVLAIAASCSVKEMETGSVPAPQMFGYTEEDQPTKTAITVDGEGVGTIWWKPADNINVFFETASVRYYSTNQEDATTVVFETNAMIGSTESASTNKWGLYPYNSSATCDGSSVTTTIPAAQQCVPETFGNNLFPMIAHSATNELHFKNVCGGIKFSLSRDDIQSITFKGNNDENIVGKVQFSLDGEENPVATVVAGEKTITLTPSTGSTFASGTNYYLVMLPTVLSQGFTMTFETEIEIGTFEYTAKSIEIKRSIFAKKADIDTYAIFEPKGSTYEYVDLGLSVNWATMNVGATVPEEYGDYFAWGETQPKTEYLWTNYKYCQGTNNTITKYTKGSTYANNGVIDNKVLLDSEDDAATANWGDPWRMPTIAEVSELIKNTQWSRVKINDVYGYKLTSKKAGYTDKWIFIPASGYMNGTNLRIDEPNPSDEKNKAICWAKDLYTDYRLAYRFEMYYNGYYEYSSYVDHASNGRYIGAPVRPVRNKKSNSGITGINLDRTSISAVVGLSEKLTATLSKSEGAVNTIVEWSSSNPSVATVNYNGTVTPVAPGITVITAKSPFGGFTATCNISVSNYSPQEIIDLGLSVKWRSMNLGAESVEEYGDYYAWGHTETLYDDGYSWDSYKYGTSYSTQTKYNTTDKKKVLESGDDAAMAELGNGWRMPTAEELRELLSECSWSCVTFKGTNGYKVTSNKVGYADKWIFLPFAGYRYSKSLAYAGSGGYYWTSSLYESNYTTLTERATCLMMSSSYAKEYQDDRYNGFSIRPVKE